MSKSRQVNVEPSSYGPHHSQRYGRLAVFQTVGDGLSILKCCLVAIEIREVSLSHAYSEQS